MLITPQEELQQRTRALQKQMQQAGLDGVFLLQNADLFYFAGTIQQGVLYIPVADEPLYMVRKDCDRAREESALTRVVPLRSMRQLAESLEEAELPLPQQAGMERDVLPVALAERLQKALPQAAWGDATPLIRQVRAIKSTFEIERLRSAAELQHQIYSRVVQVLRPGMTELELAAELEYTARRLGHQGVVRMRAFNGEFHCGDAFAGDDSAVPAFSDTPLGGRGSTPAVGRGPGWRQIREHEPIVIDYAAARDGYLTDQTRIFSLGELAPKWHQAYACMLDVQNCLLENAKPGSSWSELYAMCYQVAAKAGYAESFMGAPGSQVGFIGHGIGTEIDEFPFIAPGFDDRQLQPHMTFAFEPKVVCPGEGAIGIENTFLVTETGLERLTYSPEEIVEL